MNATVSFRLYELLKPLVKEEAKAKEIVTNIEEIIDNKVELQKDKLATKQDIADLRVEIANVRTELKTEIKEVKAELLKWMFAMFLPFYIGMIVFLIKQFM